MHTLHSSPPFAPAPSAPSPPRLRRTWVDRWPRTVLQSGDQFQGVFYAAANHRIGEPVLVEVCVQRSYRSIEIQNPARIVRLLRQVHDNVRQVRMRSVPPSPLLGNGLDIVGHRAPSLLGRLRKVSPLELLFSVSDKPFARLRVVRYLGLCHPCLMMPTSYPTAPSRLTRSSCWASMANSNGSSWKMPLQNPLIIM